MYEFYVPELTGQEAVKALTRAVQACDRRAKVSVDLGKHTLKVDAHVGVDLIRQSLIEAGYRVGQREPPGPSESSPGFSS